MVSNMSLSLNSCFFWGGSTFDCTTINYKECTFSSGCSLNILSFTSKTNFVVSHRDLRKVFVAVVIFMYFCNDS